MRTLRMRVRSECHLRFACLRAYAGDYRVGVAVHEDLVTWEGEREKTDGLHDLRQREVAGAYVDQLGVRTVGGADGPKTIGYDSDRHRLLSNLRRVSSF